MTPTWCGRARTDDEAHLPALSDSPQAHARISCAHENSRRSVGDPGPACQRPQASRCLSNRLFGSLARRSEARKRRAERRSPEKHRAEKRPPEKRLAEKRPPEKRRAESVRPTPPRGQRLRAESTPAFSSRRARWRPPHASGCTAAPRTCRMCPFSSCRFRGAS
jgi:hypothetical protein